MLALPFAAPIAEASQVRILDGRSDGEPLRGTLDGRPFAVTYGHATRYLDAPAGARRLVIPSLGISRSVEAGEDPVTVVVVGRPGRARSLVVTDGASPAPGGAAIRVVNAAPEAPVFSARLRRATRAFGRNLAFGEASPYAELPPETLARCEGHVVLTLLPKERPDSTERGPSEPLGEPKLLLDRLAQTLYVIPAAGRGGIDFAVVSDPAGPSRIVSAPGLDVTSSDVTVVRAGPTIAPDDRPNGLPARVTISPNGDGRNDVAEIEISAPPGQELAPVVFSRWRVSRPVWRGEAQVVPRSGRVTFRWDGAAAPEAGGLRREDGSAVDGTYTFGVCRSEIGCVGVANGYGRGAIAVVHVRRLAAGVPLTGGIAPGATIDLAIGSDRPSVTAALRLDTDGAEPIATATGSPPTLGLTVPASAPPGIYRVVVRDDLGETRYPPLVVRDRHPLGAPRPGTVLVVVPYLTWRAYDQADLDRDGRPDTWYEHATERDASVASFGPFETGRVDVLPGAERDARNTRALMPWLRAHANRIQVITDVEFGRLAPTILRRYAGIAFVGHSEYYEAGAYDRIHDLRARGARLAFLFSNNIYREVSIRGDRIVVDDDYTRWPGRSDFLLLGNGYRSCCFPGRPLPPYTVTSAARRVPWLFRGTGLGPGSRFGIVGTETDDVVDGLSPRSTIVLATATLPQVGGTRVRAAMAFLPGPRGGGIFTSGNMRFLDGLITDRRPARDRRRVDRLLRNVWNWLEAGRPGQANVFRAARPRPAGIRVFDADPRIRLLDVRIDGVGRDTLHYGEEAHYMTVRSGTHVVEVWSRGVRIGRRTLRTRSGERRSLIVAPGRRLIALHDTRPVDGGSARLRLVHAYRGGPVVDVAIPGVEQPIGRLAFGGTTDYIRVPVGAFAACFGLLRPTTFAAGTDERLRESQFSVGENAAFTAVAIDPPGRGIRFKYVLLRDR